MTTKAAVITCPMWRTVPTAILERVEETRR